MATIYTDFTKRDFTSNFERLLTLLTSEVPELTDRNHSDVGISLIRLLARQTDMLSFYIDEVFIEGYVSTARFKQSLIDLGTLVDCRPKLASPASATLLVTRAPLIPGQEEEVISLPSGTAFTRLDGVQYINIEDITIPIGTDTAEFSVFQLTKHELSLTPNDFTYFGRFSRLSYNLGSGVVSDFFDFEDVDGELLWTRVDTLYRSMSDDTHFMLELYADNYNGILDSVFVTIGDGSYGSATLPADIAITYYTTDGATGNCGSGVIINPPEELVGVITATNTTTATGGASAETTNLFRARLPMVVQTQRRGLTELDYDALVRSIPGVLYSQTVSRSSDTSWPFLYVFMYVLPEGGGVVSEYLRGLISTSCQSWGHFGDWAQRYIILDATEITVPITIRVGLASGYQQGAVDTAIRAAITSFFLPENIGVGQNISFSALHHAVSSVSGVDYVEFDSPESTVTASEGDTFVLGTVSITYE